MNFPPLKIFLRPIAAIAIALTATSGFGQRTLARLEGEVKDGSKPVVGALALANDYQSVWQMKTDSAGQFSFYVPAGCYDVLLSSPWFHPQVKRVCVEAGKAKKLSIKLKRESRPRFPLSLNH